MKKLLAFILTMLSLFSCSACAQFSSILGNTSSSQQETQFTTFKATFDYGRYVEGHATLLLNDSYIFFTPENYGISEIVAGDIITLEYTGEFYILETYPSRVDIDPTQIKNISLGEANVKPYIVQNQNGNVSLAPAIDSIYSVITLEQITNPYVVHSDGTFTALSDCENGDLVYVSQPVAISSIRIEGIYSYNPRNP